MTPITVVIQMTGLLLLSPNTHTPGTDGGAFPLHVLVPMEGSTRAHVEQLGWRSTKTACATHEFEPGDSEDEGVCWVSLRNWVVEIGKQQGPASGGVLPPSGAVPLSSAGYRIPADLLTETTGQRLHSRVSLYNGFAKNECAFAVWNYRGGVNVRLTNVVTWVMEVPSVTAITSSHIGVGGGSDPLRDLPAPQNDTLELFIRNIPKGEHDGTAIDPPPTSGQTQATDFAAIYDLLVPPAGAPPGVPAGQREYPVYQADNAKPCPFVKRNPGTPTCMVGSGLPQP